ncbi:unnamed protein product [Ascophyllum nodosum]
MALVDTQGFVLAVDRSLFGPQGRRWIERKLPDVATNMAFISVSTFGACVLVYHICCDYNALGYWGFLQIPKHIFNALVIHIVARALRWHIEGMLGRSFLIDDEALPDFFLGSGRNDDRDEGQSKAAVLWPWASGGGRTNKDRSDSIESDDDDVEVLSRDDHVERSQSVEMAPGQQTATASVMTEAAVIAGDAARDADGIDPATATATAAATAMAAGATEATGGHSARGEGAGSYVPDEADHRGSAAGSPTSASARGGSAFDDGAGGSGAWGSIHKISKALTSSTRLRGQKQGKKGRQPRMTNFFTEADLDEMLHSTFFIKMCDDASWLYVEESHHEPEMNWLLAFWGGYTITPRFQGEMKQNEVHRMLFKCEKGKHTDHVRIRSKATNTFVFFLGIKQPLTWVAWDRDVAGGEWEDLKLEWVGSPSGLDGSLHGDERGRVIILSRPLNAYVSWNGSRFTHVSNREGATVFMFQRVATGPA